LLVRRLEAALSEVQELLAESEAQQPR
jgi:hypothetical protein